MSTPFHRPTDPLTTPAMSDSDINQVWTWLSLEAMHPEISFSILSGIADLLREVERARAAEKDLRAKLAELERDEDEKDRAAVTISRVFPSPTPRTTT